MSEISDLTAIEQRARRLLELLDEVQLTSMDFENREHLHIIQLCLETAIDHVKKIK